MKKIDIVLAVFLALVCFLILTIGWGRPFIGHHDGNNSYFQSVAQNYNKYGILELKFGQLIKGHTLERPDYYTHHPPIFPIGLAYTIRLFGDGFWQIRFMPMVFSAVTIFCLYFFLRKYFSILPSVFGVSFWLISPMFMYFGKMANFEPITLFFIVFTLIQFQRSKVLTCFGLFLAMWSDWPGYFLAGGLFLLSKDLKYLYFAFINFLLFLLNIYAITGSVIGGGLLDVAIFRAGFKDLPNVVEQYSVWQWVSQEIRWLYRFFTPGAFLIGIIATIIGFFKKEKILLILLFIAGGYTVVFRTGAWRHDFWLYYFAPFFAYSVAYILQLGGKRIWYFVIFGLWVYSLLFSLPFFWALQNMIEK